MLSGGLAHTSINKPRQLVSSVGVNIDLTSDTLWNGNAKWAG